MEEDFDTHGSTLDQQFYDKLAVALAERVKQCGSKVPVVTGRFISYWEMRLYSDSLKASSVQCLDHYSSKSGEVIPISVLQHCPLA